MPVARPRKTVDVEKLRNLALIGCTYQAMGRALGVSADTLQRRYHEVIEEARGDGETRILAKTFQKAMAGCMRALELSLVNRCGWTLRPETIVNVVQNSRPVDNRSEAEIRAELVRLHKAVWEEMDGTNDGSFDDGTR